jgi:hypothetical protein
MAVPKQDTRARGQEALANWNRPFRRSLCSHCSQPKLPPSLRTLRLLRRGRDRLAGGVQDYLRRPED